MYRSSPAALGTGPLGLPTRARVDRTSSGENFELLISSAAALFSLRDLARAGSSGRIRATASLRDLWSLR